MRGVGIISPIWWSGLEYELGCGRNIGMMDVCLFMMVCISGGVGVGRRRFYSYINDHIWHFAIFAIGA